MEHALDKTIGRYIPRENLAQAHENAGMGRMCPWFESAPCNLSISSFGNLTCLQQTFQGPGCRCELSSSSQPYLLTVGGLCRGNKQSVGEVRKQGQHLIE